MKRYLLLALLAATSLVGCNRALHGTATVKENIPVYDTKMYPQTIVPGTFPVVVTMNKQTVTVKVRQPHGPVEFNVNVPGHMLTRDYYGDFTLTSQMTGQPWGAEGFLKDLTTRTEPYWIRESCFAGYAYGWDGFMYNVYGYRDVLVYDEILERVLELHVKADGSNRELGSMKGSYMLSMRTFPLKASMCWR